MTGGATDAGFDTWARGCEVSGPADARATAADELERLMEPAPLRMIEEWLAELSVIVARRADDDFGDSLRVTAYASRLREYPADVARAAVIGGRWKFWPAWSEMEVICERKVAARRHMIAALRRADDPPEQRKLPTMEERERLVRQLVRNKFPSAPEERRDRAVDEVLRGDCMTGDAETQP